MYSEVSDIFELIEAFDENSDLKVEVTDENGTIAGRVSEVDFSGRFSVIVFDGFINDYCFCDVTVYFLN